jgi:uncharacterized protein YcaQ
VLLSPFDRLIHDRARTEAVFDFFYRLEIYVPPAKRRWGYFVLPVLRGDRLIGRIDPKWDRDAGVLRIASVHAEERPRDGDAEATGTAIEELARWLGATDVTYESPAPEAWRRALRS